MSLPPIVKPTKKQVKNWYKKACLEQLNIFDDLNLIVLTLSKTLLDEWDKIEKSENSKNKK
jgi:hypothetical protein